MVTLDWSTWQFCFLKFLFCSVQTLYDWCRHRPDDTQNVFHDVQCVCVLKEIREGVFLMCRQPWQFLYFYFRRCCLSEVHKTLHDDYHHWTSHEKNSFLCDLDLFSRPQNSLQRLVTVSHIFRFGKIQLGICSFCLQWQRVLCLQTFYSFHLHTSIDCRHVCLLHPPFSTSHCLLCSEFIFYGCHDYWCQ